MLPLDPGSKLPHSLLQGPRGMGGVHLASAAMDWIEEWFKDYPNSNVGIAMGRGIFCLDLDRKAGLMAYEWLSRMWAEHGPPEDTMMNGTANDGDHLVYRCPPGTRPLTARELGVEGMDVKTDGGYIVAPPSVLHDGGRYTVLVERKIAEAPHWLVTTARKGSTYRGDPTFTEKETAYGHRALVNEYRELATCPQGKRNEQLNRSAFNLFTLTLSGDLPDERVEQAMEEACRENGLWEEDPFGCRATIQSARAGAHRAGPRESRQQRRRKR